MKKWIKVLVISLVCIAIATASVLITLAIAKRNHGSNNTGNQPVDTLKATVSRAEWARLLSTRFGLECVSLDSSFSDVSVNDEYFECIQSCADAAIFDSEGSAFNPLENASLDFVLSTVLSAANIETDSSALDYAQSNGIVAKKADGNSTVTYNEALKIVEWGGNLFIAKTREPVNNVVMKDTLINLIDDAQYTYESKEIVRFTGIPGENIRPGEVIIVDASVIGIPEYARKITDIVLYTDNTGILYTEDPDLLDLFDEFDYCETVVPDISEIECAEGVTVSSEDADISNVSFYGSSEQPKIMLLGNSSKNDKGLDFSFKINLTKGKVSLSPSYNDFTLNPKPVSRFGSTRSEKSYSFEKESIIPDKTILGEDKFNSTKPIVDYDMGKISYDEMLKQLGVGKDQQEKSLSYMTNKYSGGYEVTGTVTLKSFSITPDFEFEKTFGIPTGIKTASISINCNFDTSLKLKGELKDELRVATFICPITLGTKVEVSLYLVADANGEISFKFELDNHTKFEYTSKSGKKKSTNNTEKNFTGEVVAELQAGPMISFELKTLGVSIIDVDLEVLAHLKTSLGATYKTTVVPSSDSANIKRETIVKFDTSLYLCTIKLTVGSEKTLAYKVKLSGSWDLVNLSKAKKYTVCNKEVVAWSDERTISKDPSKNPPAPSTQKPEYHLPTPVTPPSDYKPSGPSIPSNPDSGNQHPSEDYPDFDPKNAGTIVAQSNWNSDWEYIIYDDGTIFIYGSGGASTIGWKTEYGNFIKRVIVDEGITGICTAMFSGCSNLSYVYLPDSVNSLGNNAFEECSSLTIVRFSKEIREIPDYCFCLCKSLTDLSNVGNIVSIGIAAFDYCSKLPSFSFPDSLTSIGKWAFSHCVSLTEIELNNGLVDLYSSAFIECTRVEKVSIPGTVTTIGNNAFKGCTNLQSVELHEGIINIENDAFSLCPLLPSITIPKSVSSIGSSLFSGCTSMQAVYVKGKTSKPLSWSDRWLDSYSLAYGYRKQNISVVWGQ